MMYRVGERISKFRKEKNMSQEELATALNVSRQTISKWETGDTLPDVYNAVALAKIFRVSLDVLILGAQHSTGESSYMAELHAKRRKTNLWGIVIGSIGSTTFAVSIVLMKALEYEASTVGITMAIIFPFLMACWGFAIWSFINVGRISNEIKYLERMEIINLSNPNNSAFKLDSE